MARAPGPAMERGLGAAECRPPARAFGLPGWWAQGGRLPVGELVGGRAGPSVVALAELRAWG